MIVRLSAAALAQLRDTLAAHPDESVVRLVVHDVDDDRVAMHISLDAGPHAGDQLQISDGITIAVAGDSAARLRGALLDFEPPRGFVLRHPDHHGTGNGQPLLLDQ